MSDGGKREREEAPNLNEELQAKRWVIVEQRPDGNCLFRAVADAVYGDPAFCDKVRQQTVEHMRAMREVYSGFVEENFDAYLDRIQLNGEVGDHPEIQAMAELYNRPILVYAADSGAVTEFRCGVDQANNEARKDDDSPPIRVLYVNGNHYNSIVDVTRPSVGVGLGLAGLVAPAVSLEEQTVARAKEASELEETEKKLVAAVIMEHGDAEAERELMEQALREDARQRAEDEARLFAEAMKASTNVPDDDALLAAALEASENEMMQRIMMESMYNQRGGGGNSNN